MKFHTPSFFIGAMFGSKKRQQSIYLLAFIYMIGGMLYIMYLMAYCLFFLLPSIIYSYFKARRQVTNQQQTK